MPPKKTIIIKKPTSGAKPTQPISVFAERAQKPHPQLTTKKLDTPKKAEPEAAEPVGTKPGIPATFKFYCVRCGQKLQAEAAWVGREVTCSTCGRAITIPPPLED
ncbi:MAG: hypothetical protein JXR37_37050 [Kiritimatiellae bacterium]|nr:hypothetical protein [Kiritimatiellia bacterium]